MRNEETKQPKAVTEKDLTKFRNHTNGMIALIVALLFTCTPLMFLVLWLYLRDRDQKYAVLMQQYNSSFDLREAELVDEGLENIRVYNHNQQIKESNYMMDGRPYLCKTCQQNYPNPGHEKITLCWNLRTIFPHDPHANAPANNPYKWYWLQVNGYPLPPDNWPAHKYWMPKTAGLPNAEEAMKDEGVKYYMDHPNHLWDRGLGNPPEWYFRKEIAS